MNDIETLIKKYKPITIENNNKVIIINTMEGKYIIKKDIKIDYLKLYKYLYTRDFKYLPKIIESERENNLVLEYQEDILIDDNQKALDLIKIVSLLHSKTIYFKEIEENKINELYNNIKNNILYTGRYYNELFDNYIYEERYIEAHDIFLNNFTLIDTSIKKSLYHLEQCKKIIEENNTVRVSIIHNNLSLDHFIKNEKEYLISWDNYKTDSPIIDIIKLYKKEYQRISFDKIIPKYEETLKINDFEKNLFCCLTLIPNIIKETNNPDRNTFLYDKELNYLSKTNKLIDSIWPEQLKQ